MSFTVETPTNWRYADTTSDAEGVGRIVAAEADAISQAARDAGNLVTAPEPSGYRITHLFQLGQEDGIPESMLYAESMDVESWEHIGPAIEVMMTRTRAEGWTVSLTVAQLNLPGTRMDTDGAASRNS